MSENKQPKNIELNIETLHKLSLEYPNDAEFANVLRRLIWKQIDNKNNVVAGGTNLGGNNLSKDDLVDALRTVEREKPKQNLIIREKDSNYADANPMNNQGDSYQVKYETSFS